LLQKQKSRGPSGACGSRLLCHPIKDAEQQPPCVRVLRRKLREAGCSTTKDGS